jgi:hypothetical protein
MNHPSFARAARVALLGFALLSSSAAFAQATRTWVSGVGDDANPCSRTAPCKTFAGAISKTAAGGIIDVLDPGGYGAVTITKSITIDGNGHVSSTLNVGTTGFLINAGASDVVVLRNLSVNGVTTGTNGIRFLAGGALHVQEVSIEGATVGIAFEPSAASELTVTGGTITRTTNAVLLKPTGAGTALAAFDGVTLVGNGGGLRAEAGSIASVRNAVISDNDNAGVGAVSSTGVAQVTVRDSLLNGNNPSGAATSAAVKANGSGAAINLHGNSIVGNGIGLSAVNGATIQSTGRNRVFANGVNGVPTVTVATF